MQEPIKIEEAPQIIEEIQKSIKNDDREEMSVRTYPNPILRQKCEVITDFKDEIMRKYCRHLSIFCKRNYAYGMSSPQVGVNKRIIVVNVDSVNMTYVDESGDTKARPYLLINPVITNAFGKSKYKEGCVSIPGVFAWVERYNTFDLEYNDIDGNVCHQTVKDTTNDIFGTIVQHEIEHLDGKLFIDNLSSYEKEKVINKINKLRRRK